MMNEQAIILPGVGNARELGGYRIGDKTVRKGRLLRTGKLTQATPEAITLLSEKYRVQAIVDFRMSSEEHNNPDPEIPGVIYRHLPVFEIEEMMEGASPESIAFYGEHVNDRMAMFEYCYEHKVIDENLYVKFILNDRGRETVREFFRLLLEVEEGRSFLWHCSDGKDRAGCGAMLILSVLGADRELILKDYLLTNEFNAGKLDALRAKVAPMNMPGDKLNLLLFMSGCVFPAYMESIIDAMTERYGSVIGYLEKEIGIDEEKREKLKKAFLE